MPAVSDIDAGINSRDKALDGVRVSLDGKKGELSKEMAKETLFCVLLTNSNKGLHCFLFGAQEARISFRYVAFVRTATPTRVAQMAVRLAVHQLIVNSMAEEIRCAISIQFFVSAVER